MYEWNESRQREREMERREEGHFTPVGQESGEKNEN
jgi:hypothetical protein